MRQTVLLTSLLVFALFLGIAIAEARPVASGLDIVIYVGAG